MPAPKGKTFTIDDLWKIERASGIALSPDGAQAVCSLASYSMHDNKGESSLWLLSTFGGGPRRLTHCGEKDGQAAWSPTGDAIAFVAKREQQGKKDETQQLYLIAPDGGEARRVSDHAPGVDAFKWLPDGRHIAFVSWVWPELKGAKAQAKQWREFKDRKETAYATSETAYRYWDHNLPMGRVPHLHLIDVKTGRVRDLFEGTPYELTRADPDATSFDIAPDGRSIVFAFDPAPVKQLDNRYALGEIEVRSGKVETLARDPDWDFSSPSFSPDGRRVAFLASHQARRHTAPSQLAMLERGRRRAKPGWTLVCADWDRSADAPLRWSASDETIYFAAEDRGRRHLYAMPLGAAEPQAIVRGGWLHGFDVAGDLVVTAADALHHPARIHAQRLGSRDAPLRLERFNDELLAPFEFSPAKEVEIRGAKGEPVQMWLTFPPGFAHKAGARKVTARNARARPKKYPLLHSIHGGPHACAGDTFHYRWNTQVFAARGYVVACVNYHGSSSFGNDFLDSITHRWGELELQDVEAGTDWLLAQPWADTKRVFATGGSYGGYMVAWMNAHVAPDRYNAYVCHAGCFDWTSMFAGDAYTWFAKEIGADYWADMAKVHSQSPHAFAATMRTPTLVIHGALDYRVPDAQGLAYYNTLKAKGVDARLVWFPDENHWILKPRNSKLWYEEYFGWLERHTKAAA